MKYNTVYKRNTTATQKHNFEIGKQNKTERKKKANTKRIPTALRTNTINSTTTKKCNKLQHKKKSIFRLRTLQTPVQQFKTHKNTKKTTYKHKI